MKKTPAPKTYTIEEIDAFNAHNNAHNNARFDRLFEKIYLPSPTLPEEEPSGPVFWPVVAITAGLLLAGLGLSVAIDDGIVPAVHGIERIMDAPARLDAQQKNIDQLVQLGGYYWVTNVVIPVDLSHH